MSPKRYFGLVRAALLLVGGLVFCWAVYVGATIPEPPPNTDGLPAGFAVMYALIVQSAGALTAQIGYALPAGAGRFRFGPLADRSVAFRGAVATAVFVTAALLLSVLGWVLPDSLPRVVSGTYAFSWLGAAAGSATGIVLTAALAAVTAIVRLVRGDPVLGGD